MANRKIHLYKDYFKVFYAEQTAAVRKKIAQTITLVQQADRIPSSVFKSIEGAKGLFEIRVEFASNIYRIFCCFDEGQLVVLFNGFQKKSQKNATICDKHCSAPDERVF